MALIFQWLVQAVKEAVTYSRALGSLANDPTLPAGLGPVSVFGGRLQTEGRDLRELFRCAATIRSICGGQHSNTHVICSTKQLICKSLPWKGNSLCMQVQHSRV